MFTVYHSNQLDVLKEVLAALIEREPLSLPFAQEVVLVQSPGMAQWLQIQLADRFEIAANIQFPLPATFIWEMFTRVLPGIPPDSAFSKDAMTWKLMWLLPDRLSLPSFTALQHYLTDDDDGRKLYQLATRIADLFDQYLVYRPHWLEAWQRNEQIVGLGSDQQWQAPLWQALVEYTRQLGQPEWHRANLYQHFINRLERSADCPPGLPSRVFICGISALPPIYLQALQALGRHIDVHLMFTNPCRFYWGDIQDEVFLAKLQNRRRQHYQESRQSALFRDQQSVGSLFDQRGEQQLSNPLLASWGKLGRDNIYLLAQQEGVREIDAFVQSTSETLLHRLQRDVLELQDRALIGTTLATLQHSGGKQVLETTDRSISVHVCHSAQREVEVLHDQLLRLFDQDSMLTARDVIVMVADIDAYTPYIQAVFGNAPTQRYLPFAISDRSASAAHPVLPTFIALLGLPESRFGAESVLALLEVPALARRFSIDERGLRLLRQWVAESGICWGLDDEQLDELELQPTGQHTWRFGLTRMLLGYAMDSRAGDWQGVLPYDESSGLIAVLAGQLADLLWQLTEWRKCLTALRTLPEWLPVCRLLLETFFATDKETEAVLVLIEQQWQNVIREGLAAEYPRTVPLVVLRDELTARLNKARISQRFLTGPVNFCTLMPMRSIPFKVICLLGMNDGVYPRTLLAPGFDLMADQPQRGDRSRRDDDRYLFLEALLSAQQRLYISYIGRAIQDNTERYPSVLISELLDYIGQSHRLVGDEDLDIDLSAQRVMAQLLCHHARMPFSPDNFLPDTEWQSYAAEWLPAAAGKGTVPPSFNRSLPPLLQETVMFDDLCRFYRHPIQAFFRQRLGVSFVLDDIELPDEEPFTLDNLSRYQLNSRLLNSLIDGEDPQGEFRRLKAAGGLPYGAFGEVYWQQQLTEMVPLADKVRGEQHAEQQLELTLEIDGITLSGWLGRVQADGLLRWRPATLTAVDGLQLWLEHLAYCAQGGTGQSRMFGRKESAWCFAWLSVSEAKQWMAEMLAGYRRGMCEPVMLLPKTAWAWLDSCFDRHHGRLVWDEETQTKARSRLLQAWQGGWQQPGESSDPYVQRLLRSLTEEDIQQVIQEAQRYLLPLAERQVVR